MKKRTLGFSENIDAEGIVNTVFSVDLETDRESISIDIPVDEGDVEFFRNVCEAMTSYYPQ